jgi:hypothetical protein
MLFDVTVTTDIVCEVIYQIMRNTTVTCVRLMKNTFGTMTRLKSSTRGGDEVRSDRGVSESQHVSHLCCTGDCGCFAYDQTAQHGLH